MNKGNYLIKCPEATRGICYYTGTYCHVKVVQKGASLPFVVF